jgi:hypothetical protein
MTHYTYYDFNFEKYLFIPLIVCLVPIGYLSVDSEKIEMRY